MQRLSAGTHPGDVLKALRGTRLPHANLSEQTAAKAILPGVHSDGELELLVRHPKAYCALDLPVVAQDTVSNLFLGGASSQAYTSQLEQVQSTKQPSNHPKYCDTRLEELKIDFWTSVPLKNEDAASAISLYLETHHPIWCFFDASQFLNDLIECKTDAESTCSPLMVSALLAFALQGYSSVNTAIAKYSYQFEEQAEKLFAAEGETDSLPTIAALALLYTTIATHGDVPRAIKYLTAAREAADRMDLFGRPNSATYDSPKSEAAASQAAWGLFNFLVQMVQFQVVQPLEHPPVMSLPEESRINEGFKSSGKQDTVSTSPALAEMQQARLVFCRLWTIVNEVFLIYRDNKIRARSLAFAIGKYRKLLDLIDTLPEPMTRQDKTPHWVLIFHTSAHMVVLDLFRPYIAEDEQHGFRAYVAEGLLFMFAIEYAPAYWNLALSGAMVFTVNAVLNDLSDQERKNYLYFCISMSQRLLPSYVYMIETIRAILAIATDKGAITKAEAIRIEVDSTSLQRDRRTDRSRGGWTVAPTVNDNKSGAIDTLADRFEMITLFDEFTEGIA
ncbi:uncharacterized protein M421DRAFT_93664 [Didymella exigua CBS 183.55]|uniref:Transcription factor domain-containing protein n=1 Tax=Didymella exigua CBS 183.55 TaxID=1150837 RepID=A0A6A5RI31_9PLEO|nr:uncharacterized protein M421DRAFT_93664 [Didymella exigua CBS 183.55]KAF1926748.1 hypothetical protein M421DRAFT_93664 [Didymella exigua CBS 183.55]